MASTDTIMQLALIEAVTVPFPGVDDVLKGKEGNSIRTKVTAVQKLLGLKDERKETHYNRESLLNFCWVRELCFLRPSNKFSTPFPVAVCCFSFRGGDKKIRSSLEHYRAGGVGLEARAPGRTHAL